LDWSFIQVEANYDKEVLKQPLKTTVALHATDFSSLSVQDNLHVIINVRDFKAIVTHAESLGTSISAMYSSPGKPLQFAYEKDDLSCQFTLMTGNDHRASSKQANPRPIVNAKTAPVQRPAVQMRIQETAPNTLGPPARPENRRNPRTLGKRNPSASQSVTVTSSRRESESLFVTQGEEEDQTWDPPNYEDTGESLGWDIGEAGVRSRREVRNMLINQGSILQREQSTRSLIPATDFDQQLLESTAFAPTQALSDVSISTLRLHYLTELRYQNSGKLSRLSYNPARCTSSGYKCCLLRDLKYGAGRVVVLVCYRPTVPMLSPTPSNNIAICG
jgi:Rad9